MRDTSRHTGRPSDKQSGKKRRAAEHNARYEVKQSIETEHAVDYTLRRIGEYRAQANLNPAKAVMIWLPVALALWVGIIWLVVSNG